MHINWIYKAQKENRYWFIHSGMYHSSGSLTLALVVELQVHSGWLHVQCMVDAVALVRVSSLEFILFSPYFIIAECLTCYCLKICLNSPWHLAGYRVKLFPVCADKDTQRFHWHSKYSSCWMFSFIYQGCFLLHLWINGLCLYCWSIGYGKHVGTYCFMVSPIDMEVDWESHGVFSCSWHFI